MHRMLNMVNTTGMEEIELYIEVVRVKLQVNQSVGGYTDLLVRENDNVAEFDMVVDLVVVQHHILTYVEYMEMMKIANMKKLMLNPVKMLMMNLIKS